MRAARQRLRAVAVGVLLTLAAAAQSGSEMAEQLFSQRLQILVGSRQWTDAARHIQQAQALRPPPVWLAAKEAEVRLAQVRIANGRADFPGALAAARLFLNGDDERAQQLLAFARELHAADAKPTAIALVKEIVRRTPAFVLAARQLAEWEPAVAEPKPRLETKPSPELKPVAEPKPPVAEVDEETALLARLRTAQEQGNIPGMLSAARLFLTGDRARSQRLLEVAREYATRGDRATAVALTKEVLRRTADFPPAKRQLADLESAARSK